MKRFCKGFGIFLAFLAISIASALAVVTFLLQQEEVRVPDLIGQDIITALEALNQQGLQLKMERREPHQLMPKDMVISQVPAPGTGIKKGRPIRVVVSLGPSGLVAPLLINEHYRKADIMIRQAGFLPDTMVRVASETIERNMVIAQSPPAGRSLEKGGMIGLLVSSGKKPPTLVTPRLVGKRVEDAITILERMGVQHHTTYRAPEAAATVGRVVLSQKPLAGYPVTTDMTVELVASK